MPAKRIARDPEEPLEEETGFVSGAAVPVRGLGAPRYGRGRARGRPFARATWATRESMPGGPARPGDSGWGGVGPAENERISEDSESRRLASQGAWAPRESIPEEPDGSEDPVWGGARPKRGVGPAISMDSEPSRDSSPSPSNGVEAAYSAANLLPRLARALQKVQGLHKKQI